MGTGIYRVTLFVATLGLLSLAAEEKSGKWAGLISDDGCLSDHDKKPEKECIEQCIKMKHKVPVLVVENGFYMIANVDFVMKHLGDRVALTGIMNGKTITVTSLNLVLPPVKELPGHDLKVISLNGAISEANCGAKHISGLDRDIACVTKCVRSGAAPVFVTEGKVVRIANADKVTDHLGHNVEITGKLDGDTVTIISVRMGR